jgi:hypothetical protein
MLGSNGTVNALKKLKPRPPSSRQGFVEGATRRVELTLASRKSGSRTIRLKILHFSNPPRSWLAPVPAISKPEDRQLIIDRKWLPVQIQPILAKSVHMARQIRTESGQRIGVYWHSLFPHFVQRSGH